MRFILRSVFILAVLCGTARGQSLIAVNTGAQVTLNAGSPSHPTVPAGTVSQPAVFNVTGYFSTNLSSDWTNLETQRAGLSGALRYTWIGPQAYATGSLFLDSTAVVPAATTVAPGLVSAVDRIQLNTQNVIAPGLHGIVGNSDGAGGGTDDAPAIRAYLMSLVSAVAGESIAVNAGGLTCSAGVVTVNYGGTTVSGARVGSVVNVSPGESGFPAGRKIVTGIGFLSGGVNPHTITYAEPGCSGSSGVTENVGGMRRGVKVYVAPGAYRLSSRIDIPGTFTIEGVTNHIDGAGARFYADGGVTAFGIYNNAYGTTMRDLSIIAVAKIPAKNTHGALDNDPGNSITLGGAGSFQVTLNNAGDAATYHNGDIVRIEGGSIVPGPIWNLQANTTNGQPTFTYVSADGGNVYAGLYEGQWLKMPGAWNNPTRVIAINTATSTVTMASNATGSVHFGAVGDANRVTWYPDAVAQIQTGGGTVNLTVEDNGLQPSFSTYMHQFASGIYASTQVHLDHVFIQGFKGAGFAQVQSSNFQPQGFGEYANSNDVNTNLCGFAYYGKGNDSNSQVHTDFGANFVDMVGIYTEQFIGVTFVHPVIQGSFVGFAGGFASNESIVSINQYSEGTANAFGAGLIRIGGGPLYTGEAGGFLVNGEIYGANNFHVDASGRLANAPTTVFDPSGGNARDLLRVDAAAPLTGSSLLRLRDGNGHDLYQFHQSYMHVPSGTTITDNGGTGAQVFFGTDGGGSPALVWQSGNASPSAANQDDLGAKQNPWRNGFIDATYPGVGSALTITANTIAPTKGIHHIGSGLIKTITVPSGVGSNSGFCFKAWPDAAFTYDATGNIYLPAGGGTATINRLMEFCYDGNAGHWAPSY